MEQSYEILHGTLEFIAKDTEVENCWDACDEKLGALRELTGDVGAMKKSQQPVWGGHVYVRVLRLSDFSSTMCIPRICWSGFPILVFDDFQCFMIHCQFLCLLACVFVHRSCVG